MQAAEAAFFANKPTPQTTTPTIPVAAQSTPSTGSRPCVGTASHRGEGTQAFSPTRSSKQVPKAVSPSINDSPDGKVTKPELVNSANVRAQPQCLLVAARPFLMHV